MTERMQDLVRQRDDAQSQLEALCGESPQTEEILARRIATLSQLIEIEAEEG